MAEKAIRLGGESTADAIVSAVDSLYPEHTFEDKEFALKHNDDEIAVDTNFAARASGGCHPPLLRQEERRCWA